MKVERQGNTVRLLLEGNEVRWLKLALERASFIDTPVSEQADILTFCGRALEALGALPSSR